MIRRVLEDADGSGDTLDLYQCYPTKHVSPAYITVAQDDGTASIGLSYAQLRKLYEAIGNILETEGKA